MKVLLLNLKHVYIKSLFLKLSLVLGKYIKTIGETDAIEVIRNDVSLIEYL